MSSSEALHRHNIAHCRKQMLRSGALVQLGEMRTVSNRARIRCTGQLLTIDHVIAFGIHWRAWTVKVRSVTSTFSEKKAVRGSVLVSVRAADGANADDWAVWETG